ncbi:TonB family protein [Marinobacteraceae bacterium S3BR75-40.1]
MALTGAIVAHGVALQLLSTDWPPPRPRQSAVEVELQSTPTTPAPVMETAEQPPAVTTRAPSSHQASEQPEPSTSPAASATASAEPSPTPQPVAPAPPVPHSSTPTPEPKTTTPEPAMARQNLPRRSQSVGEPSPQTTSGVQARQTRRHYRQELQAHIERYRQYPMLAKRQRQEGMVKVHLQMDRAGQLLQSNLEQPSPFPLLNREALALLDRAAPFPRVPAALEGKVFDWTVPIQFRLP